MVAVYSASNIPWKALASHNTASCGLRVPSPSQLSESLVVCIIQIN